jgi:hypothetical protein
MLNNCCFVSLLPRILHGGGIEEGWKRKGKEFSGGDGGII